MRTLIALAVLCTSAVAAPVPKELRRPPPVQQKETLINESTNDRPSSEIIRRFWYIEEPSHLTPERIHGGIL